MRGAPRGKCCLFAIAAVALAFALASFLSPAAFAAEVRYDYDLLGRLQRAIHPDGTVIEYVYDAAGNLLRVVNAGTAQPPAVNALSRNSIRHGQLRQAQATGTGLTGVSASASHADIVVRTLAVSATSVTLSIGVPETVPLGSHTLTFRNAAGSAQATLDVLPAIALRFLPESIALPPDGVNRQFTVSLSAVDDVDLVLTASVANPSVARVTPATFTIPVGQSQATFSIAGLAVGSTTLTLSSLALLRPIVGNVLVDPNAGAAQARYSRPLGLVKGDPTYAAGTSGPHVAPLLGIVKGDPTTPPAPFSVGPVLSPPLGLQKQ